MLCNVFVLCNGSRYAPVYVLHCTITTHAVFQNAMCRFTQTSQLRQSTFMGRTDVCNDLCNKTSIGEKKTHQSQSNRVEFQIDNNKRNEPKQSATTHYKTKRSEKNNLIRENSPRLPHTTAVVKSRHASFSAKPHRHHHRLASRKR